MNGNSRGGFNDSASLAYLRDLLTHRSGLSRGDLVWHASGFDRAEVLRRVRYLKPTWSFRSTFGYQNLMYLAAGQVIARVGNTTWDDFVTQRIFQPLGMADTTPDVENRLAWPRRQPLQ